MQNVAYLIFSSKIYCKVLCDHRYTTLGRNFDWIIMKTCPSTCILFEYKLNNFYLFCKLYIIIVITEGRYAHTCTQLFLHGVFWFKNVSWQYTVFYNTSLSVYNHTYLIFFKATRPCYIRNLIENLIKITKLSICVYVQLKRRVGMLLSKSMLVWRNATRRKKIRAPYKSKMLMSNCCGRFFARDMYTSTYPSTLKTSSTYRPQRDLYQTKMPVRGATPSMACYITFSWRTAHICRPMNWRIYQKYHSWFYKGVVMCTFILINKYTPYLLLSVYCCVTAQFDKVRQFRAVYKDVKV